MERENDGSVPEEDCESKEHANITAIVEDKGRDALEIRIDPISQNENSVKVLERNGDVFKIDTKASTVAVDSTNEDIGDPKKIAVANDAETEAPIRQTKDDIESKVGSATTELIERNPSKSLGSNDQTACDDNQHQTPTEQSIYLDESKNVASTNQAVGVPEKIAAANDAEIEATIEQTKDDISSKVCNASKGVLQRNPSESLGSNDQASCDDNQHKTPTAETEKNVELSVDIEVPDQFKTNNQMDTQAADVDSNATPEHPTLTFNKSSEQTIPESKTSEPLKVADDKALNENISSKTAELMKSMDMDNSNSTSSSTTVRPKKIRIKTEKNLPTTGLGLSLLAQYNSDSDADCKDDDVMEIPFEANKDYRSKVVEINSESESESTSSDDSDVEYLTTIRKEIKKTFDLDDDEDDDEDDDPDGASGSSKKKKKQAHMRVKGELLLEDLPPIQDLHITVPEEECIELGRVHSIINQLLLVNVLPGSLLLDLDTVLFLDKGKKVLGEIFDVLGQVADPVYCVRFNSHNEIEDKGIKIGDTVYVAPKTQYTQLVILSSLMKLRGSDASWENDIEPPPRYLDYSDDEQEREARARVRNKDRPSDHEDPIKRPRSGADEVAASFSTQPSNSQKRFTQRSGRFNQDRGPVRSPYQHQRHQAQPNAPYTGSWHSNYRQPYSPYHNAQYGPPMPSPYQAYSPGPYPSAPQMSPIPSPPPLPMYVLNPAALSPGSLNTRPQNHPLQHPRRVQTHSPPPAPPGLD